MKVCSTVNQQFSKPEDFRFFLFDKNIEIWHKIGISQKFFQRTNMLDLVLGKQFDIIDHENSYIFIILFRFL